MANMSLKSSKYEIKYIKTKQMNYYGLLKLDFF